MGITPDPETGFKERGIILLNGIKKRLRPLFYRYFEYFHLVRACEWRTIGKWLRPMDHDDVILDIGCGHGHFVRRLWRPGLRILGVDLSRNGIKIAQQYNAPDGCGFIMADAMALPFGDDMFDKVMSICAFEHFSDDRKAIKEASRVLKKEGRLVLSVDSFDYPGIRPSYRERCRKKHAVCRFYTRKLLAHRLNCSGFKIIHEKFMISSPITSLGYRLGTFFRWRGIDFMDPVIFIFLYPLAYLTENVLKLRFKKQGYILVMEAVKA